MTKSGIDQQALADMFANASAQQTAQLRQAVYGATMGALQGRELSLKNIRGVLSAVTQAAGAGAAKNPLAGTDVQALLDTAVAGMDDALLKAVEANRVALQQFVDRGIDLRETQLKKALADLDKMEDTLMAAVKKGAETAGGGLAGPWSQALERLNMGGSQAGTQASQAAQQLQDQLAKVQAAMRDSRSATLKAAQTMMDSYTALVSGVLIGMSDALKQGSAPAPAPAAKAAKPKAK
jgi:hypothetical protein